MVCRGLFATSLRVGVGRGSFKAGFEPTTCRSQVQTLVHWHASALVILMSTWPWPFSVVAVSCLRSGRCHSVVTFLCVWGRLEGWGSLCALACVRGRLVCQGPPCISLVTLYVRGHHVVVRGHVVVCQGSPYCSQGSRCSMSGSPCCSQGSRCFMLVSPCCSQGSHCFMLVSPCCSQGSLCMLGVTMLQSGVTLLCIMGHHVAVRGHIVLC